jgi:predicted MFS family arabinose efflux permease
LSQADAKAGGEPAVSFTPAYSRYVLVILFLVYVSNFVDRQILSILLDPIKQDLGASDTQMGFLTGFAFALFYTFAGIPIARLADRGVRRSIIAMGLTVWSLMTAASGLASSYTQLALARVGVGIGEAAGSPPSHSLISDYFPPERRATALGFYSTGIYFGILVGFFGGGVINEYWGWRAAFLIVGLPGLLLALVVRFTIKEPPRGHSEQGVVDDSTDSVADVARHLFSRRSFVFLSLGASLHAFAGYGFGTWVPPFLGRVHGMGTAEIGTWVGLIAGLGGATGAFLGGRLTDKLGQHDKRYYVWVPAFSSIVGLPFVFPFLLMDDVHTALIIYIPAVVFGAAYLGPTFAVTQALVKVRMRAVASSILLFIINIIGLGAGPQVVGVLNDLLSDRFGIEAVRYSLMIVGLTNVFATGCYLYAARSIREDLANAAS